MDVTAIFLTGERITWGFAEGAVPRVGDQLDLADPAAPRSRVLVQSVIWDVTERGCRSVTVTVS